MAEGMKKPLLVGQYVWTIKRKDGKYVPIFGADPLESTDDEIFVVSYRDNPKKMVPVDYPTEAIRDFVTIKPGEYAVVSNPSVSFSEDHPNGGYKAGRNEMKDLNYGKKRVITKGHFPLWPTQSIDIRPIPHLSSNQFLMVVVESPEVDVNAPYFELTMKCANIKKAVVDESVNSEKDTEKINIDDVKEDEKTQEEVKEKDTTPDKDEKLVPVEELNLKVGQRIIIPGSLTPTYIIPTGFEIVPDEDGEIIRKAVVLGPTEFCELFDEDGKPIKHKGEGRVFPGPYDVFRTEGSRNRVYDAYHLRPDRGLLLRVISDNISRHDLSEQLPESAATCLDKENYTGGDEIFIHGFDAYLVPSSAVEVINPKTRQPHFGNDHRQVFVKAIGVDQKSGIYVANVDTGNVELKKGEDKIVLDPRKEKHILRRVPGRKWNKMIAHSEQHKWEDLDSMVETPWALSIIVPNNEAILVTGKDNRRVVVGACTELLEYEEWLEELTLSKGKPKKIEDDVLETSFLRVKGNRISDQVTLETSDFVKIKVNVSYGVEFVGDTQEEMLKWFNHKNYVWLLCTNLRSRLRLIASKLPLSELYPNITDFIRDAILGTKDNDDENSHRPGLKFEENNMLVNEVEVLTVELPDAELEGVLKNINSKSVIRKINDEEKKADYESKLMQDAIDEKLYEIQVQKANRDKELSMLRNQHSHDVEKYLQQTEQEMDDLKEKHRKAIEKGKAELDKDLAKISQDTEEARSRMKLAISSEEAEQEVELKKALADIEKLLVEATADADVKRLEASRVQEGLVEALNGIRDKDFAQALAENLPETGGLARFIFGKGGIGMFGEMLKGTKYEQKFNALTSTAQKVMDKASKRRQSEDG